MSNVFLVKFWSSSCGICGRMAKYDTKVAEELNIGFISVQRAKTDVWDRFVYLAKQLYENTDRMGYPTYIIGVGNKVGELKAIGEVRGGSDKGAFRRNVQKVLDKIDSPEPTPVPAEKKTTVLKLSSTDCGICGRMAKFDQGAVEQLGYEFQTVKRSDREEWKKYQYVLDQIYGPNDVIGFPSYIAVEGTSETDMVVLGEVRGGMDKGKFKEKIQLVIKNRASEPRIEPGDDDCKYWKVRCECGCVDDEGESGTNPIWKIKYYEDENLPGSNDDYEVISTHEDVNACKDNKCIQVELGCNCNFPDLNNGDIRDGLCTLTCYKKKDEPEPTPEPTPETCDKDFTLALDCPQDCDKESGTRTINASADGVANSNVDFKWYEGAAGSGNQIGSGTSVSVNCPPAGQSQKFACQATFKDGPCDITRTENCVIETSAAPEPTPEPEPDYQCKPNDCGTIEGIDCGGCENGFECKGNECVEIGQPPYVCKSGDCGNVQGTDCGDCPAGQKCVGGKCEDDVQPPYQCKPNDCGTIQGVDCGGCENGFECRGNECVEVSPPEPTPECVSDSDCGLCEKCSNGVCVDKCPADKICENGECKDPPLVCPDGQIPDGFGGCKPTPKCYGAQDCPNERCYYCVNGECRYDESKPGCINTPEPTPEPTDPCENIDCGSGTDGVTNCGDCTEGYKCENGKCIEDIPECPPCPPCTAIADVREANRYRGASAVRNSSGFGGSTRDDVTLVPEIDVTDFYDNPCGEQTGSAEGTHSITVSGPASVVASGTERCEGNSPDLPGYKCWEGNDVKKYVIEWDSTYDTGGQDIAINVLSSEDSTAGDPGTFKDLELCTVNPARKLSTDGEKLKLELTFMRTGKEKADPIQAANTYGKHTFCHNYTVGGVLTHCDSGIEINGQCYDDPNKPECPDCAECPDCIDDGDCEPCHQCVNGSCQPLCRADQICDNGTCVCPPDQVEVDGKCISGNCVDDGDCDAANCEKCVDNNCTSQCRDDQVCDGAGTCICPPDHVEVNGVCIPGNCVGDGDCDAANCEKCVDNYCTSYCRDDQVCDGAGVCKCPDGQVECDGVCVPDPCIDANCPEGFICDPCSNCEEGLCVCPEGLVESDGKCVDPCEVACCNDFAEICVDGECVVDPCWGVECATDEICKDGVCVPDPCFEVECPEGDKCVDGVCEKDCCYGVECPPGYVCENGECVYDRCWNCCDGECPEICEDCQVCFDEQCFMDLRMLITGPTCVPIGGVNVRLTGTAKNAKDEHVHFIWYKGNKNDGGEKIAEGVGLTSISVEGPKTEDECFIYELHGEINALECAVPYDTHRVCAGDCYPECPPFTSLGRRVPKRKNEEVFGKTHQNPIEIFPNMLPSTLEFKGRI